MAIIDRRERERAARRELITATARRIAESEGWDAVTTRRLSTEIEYSQPVIYRHFASMEDIADAVALEGFAELAEALGAARAGGGSAAEALERVARAYGTFAAGNPALYDAMFVRSTRLHFAATDSPDPLTAGFGELRDAVKAVAGARDADTLTEVLWAALHGLATLGRGDRLTPGRDADRVELLVSQLTLDPSQGRVTRAGSGAAGARR